MKRTLFAAIATLALGTSAQAADQMLSMPADNWSGLYIAAHGGAMWLPPVGTAFSSTRLSPLDVTGEAGSNTGYRIGGSIGYDFTPNFGAEAEVSYGKFGIESFSTCFFGPCTSISGNGEATLLTAMGNLFIGQEMGSWRPYVGFGAGAASLKLSVPNGSFAPDGVDDRDWTWAAQAMVGADFAITEKVSIGGRYRYQQIGATTFTDTGGDPVALDSFGAHSVEVLMKFRFGG